MLVVVPINERGKPNTGMFNPGKMRRVSDGVFEGPAPRFDESVVVAATRPEITSGKHQAVQENRQGNAAHRISIVGVYYPRTYFQVTNDPSK